MDVAKMIVHQARSREYEPAIAFAGGIATYGMLMRAVASACEQLERAGLVRGSIVAVDTRNPFFHIALALALELRGICGASVQTAYSIRQSGLVPAAILVDGTSEHDSAVRTIMVDATWFTTDLQAPADFAQLLAMPGFADDDAMARIVFSSGTTGVPKSTGFSPAVIERRIGHNLIVFGGSIAGVRIGTMMGFSTLAGYILPMTALAAGGTICFGSNPHEMLHLLRSLRVDVLMTAVGQLNALLDALGNARAPDIGLLVVNGSKLPSPLLARARERLSANLAFAYGSTEAGLLSQSPASLLEGTEGVAGYLLPWVQMQVVDADDNVLAPGAEGVIRVRTPDQGRYLLDDPENAAFLRDGWFYPGDVGQLRADGLVTITGRSVEVINRGGSVVAPELIERVLTQRPDIIDAAAFGVRGPTGMEEIWAAVVSTRTINEAELVLFCREQLADKAPNVIHQVTSIQRTEAGKIRRVQTRDAVVAARSV